MNRNGFLLDRPPENQKIELFLIDELHLTQTQKILQCISHEQSGIRQYFLSNLASEVSKIETAEDLTEFWQGFLQMLPSFRMEAWVHMSKQFSELLQFLSAEDAREGAISGQRGPEISFSDTLCTIVENLPLEAYEIETLVSSIRQQFVSIDREALRNLYTTSTREMLFNLDNERKVLLFIEKLGIISTHDELRKMISEKDIGSISRHLTNHPSALVRSKSPNLLRSILRFVDGPMLKEKLLPNYLMLSTDEETKVRLAFLERIGDLMDILPRADTKSTTINVIRSYMRDKSPKVVSCLANVYGNVTKRLWDLEDISDEDKKELMSYFVYFLKLGDPSVSFYCAENFAVIAALAGRENWDKLRLHFFALSKHENFNVRNAIAVRLGEIADVLQNDVVQDDLLPVFEAYLGDANQIVDIVTSQMVDFVKCLEIPLRERLLGELKKLCTSNLTSWRALENLVSYIPQVVPLLPYERMKLVLFDIVEILLIHDVSKVRNAASRSYAILYSALCYEDQVNMAEKLLAFAHYPSFRYRLAFVEMISELLAGGMEIKIWGIFFEAIIDMLRDRVLNIQYEMAKVLLRNLKKNVHLYRDARMQDLIRSILQFTPKTDYETEFCFFLRCIIEENYEGVPDDD